MHFTRPTLPSTTRLDVLLGDLVIVKPAARYRCRGFVVCPFGPEDRT